MYRGTTATRLKTFTVLKRKCQKIVWLKPWTPLTKTLEPQTCQSLSNPSSLYSTALGCYQLTLEAETKIVQYTLRYYCSSTLLRKDLYTILHGRNDNLVVSLQSREMCVSHEIWSRIDYFFFCHKQSLIFDVLARLSPFSYFTISTCTVSPSFCLRSLALLIRGVLSPHSTYDPYGLLI